MAVAIHHASGCYRRGLRSKGVAMRELETGATPPTRAVIVQDFAASELFDRTFDEGMTLVEETAAYLDGAGRQESKLLGRATALAYAGESMKLTTRLMQVASWLLVQRAVREGAMPAADACEDRYRLRPSDEVEALSNEDAAAMPIGLNALLARTERLYDRILHLDRRMYLEATDEPAPHPVLSQFDMLQAAFG
jgi:regulator of CtrA degradation